MIYKLRGKFIRICTISLLLVFFAIFLLVYILNTIQLNAGMDTLTDMISNHNGHMPNENPKKLNKNMLPKTPNFITKETPFNTRFFTVKYNENGEFLISNTEFISSVTENEAKDFSNIVLKKGKSRGWIKNYRYKITSSKQGSFIVFVDGSSSKEMAKTFMFSVLIVLLCSGLVIILLIVILSKFAIKPVAESYDKQKQFITDANHELKTPLTLILTNLEIAESEIGTNEWLDDIRTESTHMSALVNQLVALSRMDEDSLILSVREFSLSDAIYDTASEFEILSSVRNQCFVKNIEPSIIYKGDEASIRKLISILLDNAHKYCDKNGTITISLYHKRYPVLIIENTFSETTKVELNKLFDRFYRSDKARSHNGSFGIGLSIAKAIVEKHHSDIYAYRKDKNTIAFKVIFKK
ncbi:MAG: HAMP domain-containing histidine kinase [Lachnospiraceae bacterium]|nr:HAMP domain-containing histidine kinase [Lachnospiraceae bacterium]